MKENLFKKWWQNYWPLIGYFLISVIFLYPILVQAGVPFKYDWMWPLFDMNEYWRVVFDKNSFGLTSSLGKYANVFLSLFGLVKISPTLLLKSFYF